MLIVAHIDNMCCIKSEDIYIWKTVLKLCLDYVCVDADACWMCKDSCGEHSLTNPMERGNSSEEGQMAMEPVGFDLGDQRGQETRDLDKSHYSAEQGPTDGHRTTDFTDQESKRT